MARRASDGHASRMREEAYGVDEDVQQSRTTRFGQHSNDTSGSDMAAKVTAAYAAGRSQPPPLKRRKLQLAESPTPAMSATNPTRSGREPPASTSRRAALATSRTTRTQNASAIDVDALQAAHATHNASAHRHLDKGPTVVTTPLMLPPCSTLSADIKQEPDEPSLPSFVPAPVLVTSGAYRVSPVPPFKGPNAKEAWKIGTISDFQRRSRGLGVPVAIGTKKLLSDGFVINWSTSTPVTTDADGFPCLPPTPLGPSSVALLEGHARSSPRSPQLFAPKAKDAAAPADIARHLPTPSMSPPAERRQRNVETHSYEASPAKGRPFSLFAMHKQQHAESQQRPTTPSPAASESSVKVAKSETSSRLSSPGRAISIDAEVDSSDELYVTWEEHRSMSTARQDSATTVDASKVEPAPKHVLLVEGNEPPRPLTPKFDTSTVEPLAEESPWTETEALNLQAEATEWLRNYICVFDTDRSGLASAYSQHAIFSLRQFSYLSSPPELPARPPPAHTGTVGILAALLDLPDSFAFNLRDAAPQISYDVVVLFDVFVYAQAHAPGVMLTCYVDPARCPSADEARGWRWVCEMQFVLRPNTWSEDDRAAGALWRLVAVSHQMTLRKIPLAMDWKWAS